MDNGKKSWWYMLHRCLSGTVYAQPCDVAPPPEPICPVRPVDSPCASEVKPPTPPPPAPAPAPPPKPEPSHEPCPPSKKWRFGPGRCQFSRTRRRRCDVELKQEEDNELPPCRLPECPGLLRYVHDQTQSVMPQYFQGLSMRFRHKINNHLFLTHSLAFSQLCSSGYTLTATVVGSPENELLPYGLLELSPEGYANLETRVAPFKCTRASFLAQISKNQICNWECFFDVYSETRTVSLLAVNREMLAVHFLQAITRRLALGLELSALTDGKKCAVAVARYYSEDLKSVVSASLGCNGAALCGAYRVKPKLSVAARLDVSPSKPRPLLTLGYEYRDNVYGQFTARGSADSDGVVGGTMERVLASDGLNALICAVSALYNLTNDKFELGLGITSTML